GDPITINAEKNEINLNLPEQDIQQRLKDWQSKEKKETRGTLAKYAKLVSSASYGAVTDMDL
ncbi:MAG: dihydroxy-acid dehydratase, partial [Opitutae bacterium]|nr:dihydroxy-acid dehydratase [Opitutae bacterium]